MKCLTNHAVFVVLVLMLDVPTISGDESRANRQGAAVADAETVERETVERETVDPDAVAMLQAEVAEQLKLALRKLPMEIDDHAADAVQQYSARGDVRFFSGQFQEAVDDYRAMVRIDPRLDASHWRLGIAFFYAGKPKEAASQFDKYHSFDDVDRENGIWRYFSHHRAFGPDLARKELLRYAKDDRPPFPEVYQLFEGRMTPDQVLAAIPADAPDRNSRLFYSELYIGLNEVVLGKNEAAKPHLANSILNPWPRQAGYGPSYMWHVGRLQYLELVNPRQK
ncbi:MAG: hypothetical protein KDA91_02445 [Planctomycetaceae bacterium]|nr:hypothetical protein [Planctomycetaceae bacterium]